MRPISTAAAVAQFHRALICRCGSGPALTSTMRWAYGTALTYGIDLDAVMQEVHRSNMSKLGSDGKPLIRDNGKVLKSDRYFPPDIESVLQRQES